MCGDFICFVFVVFIDIPAVLIIKANSASPDQTSDLCLQTVRLCHHSRFFNQKRVNELLLVMKLYSIL